MPLRQVRSYHDYRGNRLQTAPVSEPVTRDELKTHLRIIGTSEDDYLDDLLAEARQEIEDTTGLAFISQEWLLTLDHWPQTREAWWDGEREAHVNVIHDGEQWAQVQLPRYPLITVDSVTVYDEDGTSSAVTIADVFNTDASFLRGRLALKRSATWPIALQAISAIEIAYTAGYGANATDVPAPLKRAIRQMAAYMYEHRGDGCEPKDAFVHSGAKAILDRYRVVEV